MVSNTYRLLLIHAYLPVGFLRTRTLFGFKVERYFLTVEAKRHDNARSNARRLYLGDFNAALGDFERRPPVLIKVRRQVRAKETEALMVPIRSPTYLLTYLSTYLPTYLCKTRTDNQLPETESGISKVSRNPRRLSPVSIIYRFFSDGVCSFSLFFEF